MSKENIVAKESKKVQKESIKFTYFVDGVEIRVILFFELNNTCTLITYKGDVMESRREGLGLERAFIDLDALLTDLFRKKISKAYEESKK